MTRQNFNTLWVSYQKKIIIFFYILKVIESKKSDPVPDPLTRGTDLKCHGFPTLKRTVALREICYFWFAAAFAAFLSFGSGSDKPAKPSLNRVVYCTYMLLKGLGHQMD